MANNITGNPWYLDTVGIVLASRFKFSGGTWNDAAATNQLILLDSVGRTVFKATFPTDLQPVAIPDLGWVNGLVVNRIDGGNVTLVVGKK